ncbi:hypothetical protein G6F22_021039 [Rhizopus arrhizus]|nr:hypothetical protein G6F22_021039 [Rhizopus arrhizus]
MAFGRARLPPRRPHVVQARAVGLGAFIGQEEGDFDMMAVEHIRDQRRHAQVAGVEGQVDGLVARRRRRRVRHRNSERQDRRDDTVSSGLAHGSRSTHRGGTCRPTPGSRPSSAQGPPPSSCAPSAR